MRWFGPLLAALEGLPVPVLLAWPINGQHHGSAPSLKGMSGGGLWQVSLSREVHPAQPPALAAMVIEQPRSYRTAILTTRAPLIRSFIRRFDTHA